MRFLFSFLVLFFFVFFLCNDNNNNVCHADLRYAAIPKNNFTVRNRANSIAFKTKQTLYMEPSTFGYQGLANQKQYNYDNFLRSNIDNEQDNRNFVTEQGKDHLPFRTLEGRSTDATFQLRTPLTLELGKEYVLPLRMNQPHAYEIELNIWINQNTIVVPIKRPVCAGEGYQDGVISFTVPTDFNYLGTMVKDFSGCTKVGDCVLQMYAHSVEPRTYAAGTPIIIPGWDSSFPNATDNSQVQQATKDPGTDLTKQPNDVCLPSNDPSSNIASAVPRFARHVSDVYNHAYQNSDYSPYSGQQHESISKNLQAACILRMVNANRGELGKSILTEQTKIVLANLRMTADNIVKNYETITNRIINQILKNDAKTTGTIGGQTLSNCFRCAETGSVSLNRLEMHTAIPSFKISNSIQLYQARQIIGSIDNRYSNLINVNGVLSIYYQALRDIVPLYLQLQSTYGLHYQPAMKKSYSPPPSSFTLADATSFRTVNGQGSSDGGKYAATQAKAKINADAAAAGIVIMDDVYNFNDDNNDNTFIINSTMLNLDNLSGNEIELITIPNTFPLSPNDDDDPSKQMNYSDREDAVEALPIGETDASLPSHTTTTTTTTTTIPPSTTVTTSITPTTSPTTIPPPIINTTITTTVPTSTTTTTPIIISSSSSINDSLSTGAVVGIIIGAVVLGVLIGIGLSLYHYQKNQKKTINNIQNAAELANV